MSKYATFFNGLYFVAYAAAEARQSGRAFDASQLALLDDLHCVFEVDPGGMIGMGRVERRHVSGKFSLILLHGNHLIEAIAPKPAPLNASD
jgi:hypothetical protein